jgi:transcription termination/antitermination protein NusA
VENFMKQLDVDEEVAAILVQEGFSTVEEVAYVPASELAAIEDFDEDIIKELRNRARDVLLTQAIATEEVQETSDDLFQVEGMSNELAEVLSGKGIHTRDELAEQAIDDLMDIDGMDEKRAGELIMAARKHWFESADQKA